MERHMWTPEQFVWAADHVMWTGLQVWLAWVGISLCLNIFFGGYDGEDH